MPNHLNSTFEECSEPPHCPTANCCGLTTVFYQAGYQQALTDFAITDFLGCLKTYSDANFDANWLALTTHEAEALVAILIQTLIANLNGKFLVACLRAIRRKTPDIPKAASNFSFPLPTTNLPANFPDVEMPCFLYGDRLQWIAQGETTDWGIVIGWFYGFAPHTYRWQWCYLILLDANSPSVAWTTADLAWEEDLQAIDAASADGISEREC